MITSDAAREYEEAGRGEETEVLEDEATIALSADLRAAALSLKPHEVRFLVDTYYTMQKQRIRCGNQTIALDKDGEPHKVISWLEAHSERLEAVVRSALRVYAEPKPLAQWTVSNCGIKWVLTAGLLGHIDLNKAPTVGHIYRFAGVDPSRTRLSTEAAEKLYQEKAGGRKLDMAALEEIARAMHLRADVLYRMATMPTKPGGDPRPLTARNVVAAMTRIPWNKQLKTLVWKIGQSLRLVCNRPASFYGPFYLRHKAEEIEANEAGQNATAAAAKLPRYGKSTEAYKWLKQGKLSPGHILQRSERWTAKLFLSHYHWVGRELEGLPVPAPYPVAFMGHKTIIPPPNWTTHIALNVPGCTIVKDSRP